MNLVSLILREEYAKGLPCLPFDLYVLTHSPGNKVGEKQHQL